MKKYPVIMLAVLAVLFLGGCITTSSTGVQLMGDGTYLISKQSATALESSAGVKNAALKEAREFCEKQGRVMVVVSLQDEGGIPAVRCASVNLRFKALTPAEAEKLRTEAK